MDCTLLLWHAIPPTANHLRGPVVWSLYETLDPGASIETSATQEFDSLMSHPELWSWQRNDAVSL